MSQPQPQAPQQQHTHVLIPIETVSKVSRLLTRLALDGQEATELVQALGQSLLVTPKPVEPPEDPPSDEDQDEDQDEKPEKPEMPPNHRLKEGEQPPPLED